MNSHPCVNCGASISAHANYCNFECTVAYAKKAGGAVIAPNGLPITCVRADATMLEHEHADHDDYKFPVVAKYIGERAPLPEWDTSYENEIHALLYANKYVALTIYECCFTIWSLVDGVCLGGFSERGKWQLTDDSLAKIRASIQKAPDECEDAGPANGNELVELCPGGPKVRPLYVLAG